MILNKKFIKEVKEMRENINSNKIETKEFYFEEKLSKWFSSNYKLFGINKILKKNKHICPDYVVEFNSKKIKIEIETLSGNYYLHKHRTSQVDVVICIKKNKSLPVPVIEIKDFNYVVPFLKIKLSLNVLPKDKIKIDSLCRYYDVPQYKIITALLKIEKQFKPELKELLK